MATLFLLYYLWRNSKINFWLQSFTFTFYFRQRSYCPAYLNLLHVQCQKKHAISFLWVPHTAWKLSVSRVFLVRFQHEWGKIRTRKTENTDDFHLVLKMQWGTFRVTGFTFTSMYIISNILMLLFYIWSFICMLEIRFCPYGCDNFRSLLKNKNSFYAF